MIHYGKRSSSLSGILALLLLCSSARPQDSQAPEAKSRGPVYDAELHRLFQFLDRDGNGRVAPYEGVDAILLLTSLADSDSDGLLALDELREALSEEESEQLQVFRELDVDADGTLTRTEIPTEFHDQLGQIDTDGDDEVSVEEFLAFEEAVAPRQMFEQELLEFLNDVDGDGDGAFALSDLPEREQREFASEFQRLDADKNGQVTWQELLLLLEEELEEAQFTVDGSTAEMSGVIGPSTPSQVLELIFEHPEVETIVMLDVPGSMDDEANLRAASYVRKHGLNTSIPAHGEVASGGTDFFLAGAHRAAKRGARFGVHSWSGFDEEGADLPRSHPEHAKYLDFYREMGIPENFYWYTLEAAAADDIHWMTEEEIERFELLTSPLESSSPLDIETSAAPNGIVPLPAKAPRALRDVFAKYTRILAPNGGPIHFFAQDGVHDEQLVRAREVMRFYLTDVPGSKYGADKSSVANAMADNRAGLVFFNTERDAERAFAGELGELDLFLQDLYAEESVVEGSATYRDNSVRDATLEEVFHLVQGAGIQPALPRYHARIEEAMRSAVENRRWFTNPEWEAEGSSSFEYIISVIDVYYGFWAHDPHGNGESFHGEYRYCTRAAIEENDPLGVEVLREFLPAELSFPASISAEFEGEFSLSLSPEVPYTLKSQFLTKVRLTGDRDASLAGNDHDNRLVGNVGDNRLTGRGGHDRLLGGDGQDTAVFRGSHEEYEIISQNGLVLVADQVSGRDGTDQLREIEHLQFSDSLVPCPN